MNKFKNVEELKQMIKKLNDEQRSDREIIRMQKTNMPDVQMRRHYRRITLRHMYFIYAELRGYLDRHYDKEKNLNRFTLDKLREKYTYQLEHM